MNKHLDYPSSNNKIGDGPEGPEVKNVTNYLIKRLVGKKVTKIEGTDIIDSIQYPAKIVKIWCIGKQIFFHFFHDDDRQEFFINFHLGMEGNFTFEKNTPTSIRYVFDGEDPFCFNNKRFGKCKIIDRQELIKKVNSIGPDFLSEEVSLEEFIYRYRWYGNRIIAEIMMDQDIFSGIGNYLRSEILYLSRVNPHRIVSSLTDIELEKIYYSTLRIMEDSYQSNGMTIRTYKDPGGKKGSYVPMVYSLDVDENGHQVVREKDRDGRMMHWVPQLQT